MLNLDYVLLDLVAILGNGLIWSCAVLLAWAAFSVTWVGSGLAFIE